MLHNAMRKRVPVLMMMLVTSWQVSCMLNQSPERRLAAFLLLYECTFASLMHALDLKNQINLTQFDHT